MVSPLIIPGPGGGITVPLEDVGFWDLGVDPSFTAKVAYAYAAYFGVPPGETLDSVALEFITPSPISPDQIHSAVEVIRNGLAIADMLIVSYMLYEKTEFQIDVPEEICLEAFGFRECFIPPLAGTNLLTGYRYVLGLLIQTFPKPLAVRDSSVRAALPGIGALLVIFLGAIAVIGTVALVVGWWTGRVTKQELTSFVKDVLQSPGNNIAAPITAAAWPFAAMGIAMVAAGLLIPFATMKAGAEVPIGPARLHGEVGTAPAPTASRRR